MTSDTFLIQEEAGRPGAVRKRNDVVTPKIAAELTRVLPRGGDAAG